MSLGLRLRAELSVPAKAANDFMERVQNWIISSFSEVRPRVRRGEVDQCPALFFQLHPAAEEIDLILADAEHVVVSANTTTVGPGYHLFLTSFLKSWATEFRASWEIPDDESGEFGDETGFFFTAVEERLRAEMFTWLEALANTFFDGSIDSDSSGIHLCMPMSPQFESDQAAITALGPRSREWLYETSQDGTRGGEFFAWKTAGFSADYYLGRALTQMWCDVRWRKPLNQAETDVLRDVAHCLRRAHEMDPSLTYPWAEWSEILELLDSDSEQKMMLLAETIEKPIIGYRRSNLRVTLPGGWSIRLPGSVCDFEEGGDGAISITDPPREVWFTAFASTLTNSQLEVDFAKKRKTIVSERPEHLIERDDYIATATVSDGEEKNAAPYYVVRTSNNIVGARSICTIVYSEKTDQQWAIDTWRSIQPPPRRV